MVHAPQNGKALSSLRVSESRFGHRSMQYWVSERIALLTMVPHAVTSFGTAKIALKHLAERVKERKLSRVWMVGPSHLYRAHGRL